MRLHQAILFLVFILLTTLNSQVSSQVTSTDIDTSYFKPGNDQWNLIESVAREKLDNVKMLLESGVDPDAISETGNSALIYAVERGNMEIMDLLVKAGADVDASGYKGETPLFMAIFNNDFQAAKYLLEQGADPNIKDDYGVTPLIYASATNQYQSADLLLFYEAEKTSTDNEGNDAMIAAVTFENIETTDVLLQNGMDPNVQDTDGNTPLIISTQRGRYDLIDLLLENNADPNISNDKNYTPLAYALTYNDVKATKMLIAGGADANHSIEKGRNMAELARISKNDSLITMISLEGATVPPGLDFSEFRLSYVNSFNRTDYLMGFRGGLVDSKQGYFFETGVDYRPFLLRIQVPLDDTIFQFRERRIGWSHGIGKYFTLYEAEKSDFRIHAYGMLGGYLSFPQYAGTSRDPGMQYKIIPSAGMALQGRYVGMRTGVDWYNFDNQLDNSLKVNLTVFFRIEYPEVHYDRKEIIWDE